MASERPPIPRGDRLKQLRAFCQVARVGSITRAAEHIFSSQPAVSQHLQTLEEEFGVTLFERRGPRISLTAAGRRLYETTLPTVAALDRLPDTFAAQHRGEVSGELQLAAGAATAGYVIPRYLKPFQERYPGVRVNVRTGTGSERLDWLRAYEVDVAFAAVDVPPPDLSFQFAFSSRHSLITPEDHPLAGRESVELAEAAGFPAIAPASGGYTRDAADMVLRQLGVAIDAVLEVDGWSVIKRYVEAGVGIAVVPDLCLNDRDRVWRIPFNRYFLDRRYGVLTRRDLVPSPTAERFIELLGSGFRAPSG